jgi:hypothetical protein
MPTESSAIRSANRGSASSHSVEEFLSALDHPLKAEIIAIREIILSADPSISEQIKWNAPSFRTMEHFATMHLRSKESVQVIMHLGARKRATAETGITIADPEKLLEWLGKDRAAVKFHGLEQIESQRSAFTEIVREWITYV